MLGLDGLHGFLAGQGFEIACGCFLPEEGPALQGQRVPHEIQHGLCCTAVVAYEDTVRVSAQGIGDQRGLHAVSAAPGARHVFARFLPGFQIQQGFLNVLTHFLSPPPS